MFSLVKNIVKNTNKLKIKSIISPFSDSILKSNLLLNTNKKFFFFKKSKNKNDSISSSENVKQEKENIAKVENKLKEENKSEELKGDENKTSSESEKVNLNTEEGSDKMDEKEKESTKENKNESNEIFTKPLLSQMEDFNKNGLFDKTLDLYNTVLYRETLSDRRYLKVQYKIAKQGLENEYHIIQKSLGLSGLPGDARRGLLAFLLLGCLFYYLVKSSIIQINYDKQDDSNLEKSKDQNKKGLFSKLFDVDSQFEISFAKDISERLSDVRGIDEVSEEIQQLIDMIKEPQKYLDAGAKLHKGVLLCGKPGTGKTLIARAIAGDAGVNFIFLTGSDFDEMFVGVGASRIRKLFKTARENSPCIIFIDEIDSLLTSSRRSGEHSSSRATLNQFLAEMDGFNRLEKIYVIGATNHEKDLDSAAVRPGRFDKKIHINLPDEVGRIEIIKYYLDKIKIEKENLDPTYIARLTPGFSGAEIENLVNLSLLHALNQEKSKVSMEDFYEARDRVLMGIPRKSFSTPEKSRYRTSLHEAGHTLMCYKSPLCRKTLHKVTIIPRGHAAGVTLMLADEESLHSKSEFNSNIDTAMGGHVAEELLYGSNFVTAGCSSDLNKATQIAQQMVKNFGMYGDKVGYIYVEDEGYSWEDDEVSDKYKTQIDETVKVILKKESHDRVFNSLNESANELKNLAQKLYQYDDLNFEEIEAAIEGRFNDIKRALVRDEFKDIEDQIINKV